MTDAIGEMVKDYFESRVTLAELQMLVDAFGSVELRIENRVDDDGRPFKAMVGKIPNRQTCEFWNTYHRLEVSKMIHYLVTRSAEPTK